MENYKISEEAKDDLLRIHEYGTLNVGDECADIYFLAFFDPSVDYTRKGYRKAVCGVDSIYYRLNTDMVEIMAIVGQQDFNKIL